MKIASIMICDVLTRKRPDTAPETFVQVHTYETKYEGWVDGVTVGGINLFPNQTARTNVAIRGVDGKFISYRNPNVPKRVADAIANLKPFPTV